MFYKGSRRRFIRFTAENTLTEGHEPSGDLDGVQNENLQFELLA